MISKPKRQGQLDCLCGIYSIVNSFKQVLGSSLDEDDVKLLFEACCRSVAAWPVTLWKGLDFEELMDVIKRAENIEPRLFEAVEFSFPFEKSTPPTSKMYWQRFHTLFEEYPEGCAIIGMTHPDAHWVVALPKSEKQLSIHDPRAVGPIATKNISQIHAGDRRPPKKHWKLERNELVFFRKS
jgi:hypothetical protein